MLRNYRDFLPSYLDGPNIRKHAEIIEKQDMKLYEKLCLLRDWNRLDRPILIEKNQTNNRNGTLKVHINTPTPIKEIYVKGVYEGITVDEETITYAEDELTTTETRNYNLLSKIEVWPSGVSLPTYKVQVTTHDGTVYTKQWPENDTIQGNSADHDEYLDIIGAILGIQRRKYSKYSPTSVSVGGTIPPFMAKQLIRDPSQNYIQECTEDDYYYYLRLKEFVTGFGEESLLVLMANVLYSVDSSIIEWDTTRWYPVGLEPLTIPLYLRQANYSNYPLHNIDGLLKRFVPITRVLLAFVGTDYIISITDAVYYPNYAKWEGNVTLDDMPVKDATLDCSLYLVPINVFCVSNANGEFIAKCGGTFPSDYPVIMYVGGANLPSYATPTTALLYVNQYSVFCMDLVAWNSKKWNLTPVTTANIVQAYQDDTTTINSGRGVLCHTPALDFEVVNTSAYKFTVSFHCTSQFQRIGFAMVTEDTENNTAEYSDGVLLKPMDYITGTNSQSTTHTLVARFLNHIMYLYIDGLYTGFSYDYSNVDEGILSLVSYNPLAIADSVGGVQIGAVGVENSVDISTAPVGGSPYSLDTDLPSKWSFIPRGESGTDPTFNDDGTISCGKYTHHIYNTILDKNKIYKIYFYKNDNTINDLGVGVCNNARPPSRYPTLATTVSNGVQNGINKATLSYEDNTWKIQYNEGAKTSLSIEDNNQRYLDFVTPNGDGNTNKILYIMEENN